MRSQNYLQKIPGPGKWTVAGVLLLSGLVFFGLLSPAGSVTTPPALRELIDEAQTNNSELLALEQRLAALEVEVPFVGSLQDPVIGIGLVNVPVDSFDLDQEAMTQKLFFIGQKFPWFGTLELRQQAAALKALEAQSRLQNRRLQLRFQLVSEWYELGSLQRSLEVVESLQAIVTQSLRIAESRYATGKGLQQDILAGQVRLSELIGEAVTLKGQIGRVRSTISGLLNRSTAYIGSGALVNNDEDLILPDTSSLNNLGLTNNPILEEKLLAVDRARVEVELAQAAYKPDFDLRLSYGQRDDNPLTGDDRADFLSATLAMSVPLYQSKRQDLRLAGAEKRLKAAQTSLQGFSQTLPHTIDRLVAEIEAYQQNHKLFRDALTVQAANLAASSLAAYSVGKVEFTTMLASRMGLLRFELRAEIAQLQMYKKLAELDLILGGSLSLLLESP